MMFQSQIHWFMIICTWLYTNVILRQINYLTAQTEYLDNSPWIGPMSEFTVAHVDQMNTFSLIAQLHDFN